MSRIKETIFDDLSRRSFLQLAVKQAVGSTVLLSLSSRVALASQAIENIHPQLLAQVARDLFPHDDFPDQVYAAVASGIVEDMDNSAETRELVEQGLARLRAAGDQDWSGLSQEQRIEDLTALQEDPLFMYLLNKAVTIIYTHPEVWKIIGYGGSAIEHGGYLKRGFDDIDWLPQD